ncbi:hypothetical protein ES705_24696 [subsurface metagenome]
MGYRCLQDNSGYCSDPGRQETCAREPSCETIDGVHVLHVPSPTSCTLDPQKCGFFITWKEVCSGIQPIEE